MLDLDVVAIYTFFTEPKAAPPFLPLQLFS